MFTPTPLWLLAGSISVTVGATRLIDGAVPKVWVTVAAIALPALSSTPAIFSVYVAPPASGAFGVSVSSCAPLVSETVAGTTFAPCASVTPARLVPITGSLNCTWIGVLVGTCCQPLGGLVPTTVGPVVLGVYSVVKLAPKFGLWLLPSRSCRLLQ